MGVLTAQFPRELVNQVLFETERMNVCERALPAHVMVYDVLALALYAEVSTQEVLRCVVEGARWLDEPTTSDLPTKIAAGRLAGERHARDYSGATGPVPDPRARAGDQGPRGAHRQRCSA